MATLGENVSNVQVVAPDIVKEPIADPKLDVPVDPPKSDEKKEEPTGDDKAEEKKEEEPKEGGEKEDPKEGDEKETTKEDDKDATKEGDAKLDGEDDVKEAPDGAMPDGAPDGKKRALEDDKAAEEEPAPKKSTPEKA